MNLNIRKNLFIFLSLFILLSLPFVTAVQTQYNLTYDNNGNLIQGVNRYYQYNGFNQLEVVKENNQNGRILEKYFYDENGQRIKKIVYALDGSNTIYYYPMEEFVSVVNSSGIYNAAYFYQDGVLVGQKKNQVLFYMHPDHLGSTNLVTDNSGNIVEETFYYPYGGVKQGGESKYLYNGKELDNSGLYYYGARYYDPYTMLFTQPDKIIQEPYNSQNLNRYSYVINNPYKYVDPTGHWFETFLDVGFMGMDIYDIKQNPSNWVGYAALTADVTCAALPFLTGGGLLIKGLSKGTEAVDKGIDAARAVDKIKDAGSVAEKARELKNLEKVENKGKLTRVMGDSKIREYGKLREATNPGTSVGDRFVKEQSRSGETLRVWHETYDSNGRVTQVKYTYPEVGEHFRIDPNTGKVIGVW